MAKKKKATKKVNKKKESVLNTTPNVFPDSNYFSKNQIKNIFGIDRKTVDRALLEFPTPVDAFKKCKAGRTMADCYDYRAFVSVVLYLNRDKLVFKTGEETEKNSPKLQLTVANAELKKLQLKRLSGQLVSEKISLSIIERTMRVIKDRLLSAAGALTPKIYALKDANEIEGYIDDFMRRLLNEMAVAKEHAEIDIEEHKELIKIGKRKKIL